jgi:hypothetical protein
VRPGVQDGKLALQVGDRDVAVPHGAGNAVQGLVGHLHVVAPQGGRRPHHRNVGGGHRAEVQRRVIGVLAGQLPAPPGGGEEDGDEDHDDREQQDNGHT